MFTSNVLNNKCFRKMKRARLWKNVILWAISRREISYRPDSECCTFFHRNLSDLKSSEDTLLYLYVIWNMLKSADLHETILTPVICHKHVRCHDGVTLYFSVMFPSVAPKKTRKVTNLAFFQGVFHVLERYIGFEPWDLFPLTIKCYRKCLQNYKGTIFGVAWTEKYRFEIINAVTDEPKGTIFSVIDNLYRPTLLDRTISFFSLVSRPLQGKIDEAFDFLSCSSLGDCVIFIFI